MSSVNILKNFPGITTHGGSLAKRISHEEELRRSVLSCLLWEKEFYEDGESIAQRIFDLANQCSKEYVSNLAIEARNIFGLRHVPLLLLLSLIQTNNKREKESGPRLADVIDQCIRRPDEMTELLAMYWKDKKLPQSRQLLKGLAKAFLRFDEYSLAKYNRDTPVKLRDVMFLTHPKPRDEKQAELFKRVANNQLKTPDTWEVELSAGKNKKETFERLIQEGKLGYLALLRNLRNMEQAGCDEKIVAEAILARKGAQWVFPFRYVAAARHAPRYEKFLDQALIASLKDRAKLSGTTCVLVDVSGSMGMHGVSRNSDITRLDAAATLASMLPADDLRVFTFSEKTVEVPARMGMAGVDAIRNSQPNRGTNMFDAIDYINRNVKHDRLICITDEQDTSRRNPVSPTARLSYMINVASYKNGVGYGDRWTVHLDGFSESIVRYILEIEEYLK